MSPDRSLPSSASSPASPAESGEHAIHAHRTRLLGLLELGRAIDSIELLHELGAYVAEDLPREEERMRAAAYPATEAHVREHEALRATLADLVKAFARYGNDPRVTERLRTKIFEWLETHVRESDRALCEFLRAREHAA